jgi:hypothetical protein
MLLLLDSEFYLMAKTLSSQTCSMLVLEYACLLNDAKYWNMYLQMILGLTDEPFNHTLN